MKFKKILLTLFIVLFASGLALIGIAIFSSKNEYGFKSRRDILDGEIIEVFNEKEQEEVVNTAAKKYVGSYSLDSNFIVDDSYASLGLIVAKNAYDSIGFYSLHSQKWLISPRFSQAGLVYQVIYDAYLGYYLGINYGGQIYIYDSLSNIVYEGISTETVQIGTDYVNEHVYLEIIYTRYGIENTKVYEYQDNGAIKEVSAIPTFSVEEDEDKLEFNIGSLYGNFIELEKYGLEGYLSYASSASGNKITIFDKGFKVKFSYDVPFSAEIGAIIGHKLYYQIAAVLPEDAEKYDCYVDGNKYNINTYSVNLKNGKVKEENLSSIVLNSEGYYDKDKEQAYSIVTLHLINDDKTVSLDEKKYLFDENGNMRDDVTYLYADHFEKVDNNLYNTKTKILYNSELEIISYLTNLTISSYKDGYFIAINSEGKYGILDYNAIVKVAFEYDNIYNTIINDCVVGMKDGEYYRLNILTGTATKIQGEVKKVADNLFAVTNNGFLDFVQTDGTVLYSTYENNSNYSTNYNMITSVYGNANYIVIKTRLSGSQNIDTVTYVTICVNDIPGMENFAAEGRR